MRAWVWIVICMSGTLSAGIPTQQAQADAYRNAAQSIARACVTVIEQYKIDHLDRPDFAWDGQSCQQAGLISGPSAQAIGRSLIALRPDTLEGYQVTVWPREGGESVALPATLTPKPTRWQTFLLYLQNNPGQIVGGLLGAVLGALMLYGFAFSLPSYGWLGKLGLFAGAVMLGLLGVLLLSARSSGQWAEVGGYIALALIGLLVAGLVFAVPRLAVWWGREKWWVSVGLGLAAVLVTLLPLALLNNLLPDDLGSYLPSFYSLPLSALLLSLYALWRRFGLPASAS